MYIVCSVYFIQTKSQTVCFSWCVHMFTLYYHNDRYVRLASLSLERCALCLLCECILPYITIVDWMKQYRDFIVATFNGLALVVVLLFFFYLIFYFFVLDCLVKSLVHTHFAKQNKRNFKFIGDRKIVCPGFVDDRVERVEFFSFSCCLLLLLLFCCNFVCQFGCFILLPILVFFIPCSSELYRRLYYRVIEYTYRCVVACVSSLTVTMQGTLWTLHMRNSRRAFVSAI